MPTQYLSTSRLANVIQLISLGQQTGILRALRGHGPQREMGQIQFIDGQPAAALLGQLTGPAALNVLSNWGECHYAFEDAVMAEDGSLESTEPVAGPAYGAWNSGTPSFPDPSSSYHSMPPGGAGGSSASTHTSWPGYGAMPPSNTHQRSSVGPSMPLGGPGHTSGLTGRPPSYPSGPGQQTPSQQPMGPSVAASAATPLPRRTTRVDLTDPLPLDRRERMVLLLVDGKRSVSDLARLTRRTEDEVRAVLGNLKMLGLIE
jgi:hypothetical protein